MNDEPQAERPPAPTPRLPLITLGLIVINLIVFAICIAAGASPWLPTPQKMIELGASFGPLTLGGEPWRLLTSMFLHFGVLHVALNMIGLWSGGRLAESMYGRVAFAALYLVAGLAGGLASVSHNTHAAAAGASGAIFGVFGAIGAFLLVHRHRFDPTVVRKELNGLGVFLFYNLIYGFSQKSIDMSAHLGGLAAGFVVGLGFEWGRTLGARSLARVAVVTALGLGAVAGAVAALPTPAPSAIAQSYQEFDRVQATSAAAFNAMVGQAKAGTLTDAEFGDRLEKELLPPWLALRDRLQALPPPPANSKLHTVHARLMLYVNARISAWTALADLAGGRATDTELSKDLGAQAEEAYRQLTLALGATD